MICYGCEQEKKEIMAEGTALCTLCYDCYCKLRDRSRLRIDDIAKISKASIRNRLQIMARHDAKKVH